MLESLNDILKQKAYEDIKEKLAKEGIEIEKLETEELEALINEKVQIMQSELKGVGIGVGISVLVSILGF